MYKIDYYAYMSGMRKYNAGLKLFLSFFTLIICIASDNILLKLAAIICMSAITLCIGKIKPMDYIRLFEIPLGFMILGSIAIAVEIGRQPLWEYSLYCHIFYLGSSRENIIRAVRLIITALGAVSALYMLILSTPISEIIMMLKKLKIPSLIIELMNLIYRYTFIIMDTQEKMKQAAQSRLGYLDFKTSCSTFGKCAGNLFVVSLKKSGQYYDAMLSRGYEGGMDFLEDERKIKKSQLAWLAIYIIIMIFLATGPVRL